MSSPEPLAVPEARTPPGVPALVVLGLLGLSLPFLVLLFSILPTALLAFLLHIEFVGRNDDASALAIVLLMATAAAGLAVLAGLTAFLLRLTCWPRPVATTVLLLVALVPVVLQAPAVAAWSGGELGKALGIEIGPTSLGIGPPGMIGPSGYLHLAVVVLTLLTVELWHRPGPRLRRRTRVARGTGGGTNRHRPPRSGLACASAALALTVPVSTLLTLEYLRADTTRTIQKHADAISGYPYPVAVLDAPGWRAWHLSADYEQHRLFKVVYTNDDGAQLEIVTRPEYDLVHNCPGGLESVSTENAEFAGVGGGEAVCEESWVDVSGLNGHASDYGPFLARAVIYDAWREPSHSSAPTGAAEARVDLRESGSPHYVDTDKTGDSWAEGADLGPAVVLVPANDPRESVLQGEVPFDIPVAELKDAAAHVRLLNPADGESARELAASVHLAR